jgi:hypothetical protein
VFSLHYYRVLLAFSCRELCSCFLPRIASTDPLEKEVEYLKEGLRAIKEEQQYIVVREMVHRNSKSVAPLVLN